MKILYAAWYTVHHLSHCQHMNSAVNMYLEKEKRKRNFHLAQNRYSNINSQRVPTNRKKNENIFFFVFQENHWHRCPFPHFLVAFCEITSFCQATFVTIHRNKGSMHHMCTRWARCTMRILCIRIIIWTFGSWFCFAFVYNNNKRERTKKDKHILITYHYILHKMGFVWTLDAAADVSIH